MTKNQPTLVFNQVSKSFTVGKRVITALKQLTIELKAHSVVALVGPRWRR